jgi:TBC1 domain family protein 5
MNLIEIPKKNKEDCINSFRNFILKDYSLDNLYKLSMIGELGEKNIRGMAWKIFMEVLPANSSIEKWIEKLKYLREEYKILSDKMTKKQNFFKKEEENKKENIIDLNNIIIRKNSLLTNPFHEEKETKKLINLDLNRTFQELALFHNEEIKNKLSRILFIWNNENPDLGYQQGMNDIVSIIFLCLYPYYFPNEKKISIESIMKNKDKINNKKENSEILYLFFHDEEEFESDLYICFNNIMKKGVKSLYDFDFVSKDKQIDYIKKIILFKNEYNFEKEELNSPLNLRCNMLIKEKLKKLDYELYNHFNKIGLDCTIFLQRWLKCIFNREFELKDVLIIWDAVIASPEIKKEYNLSKIDLIALSMILRIRNILILCDQNQCFMMLLQYPRIESILELIIFSDKLKEAILDIISGRRSLFLENVKNFIINYKNNGSNKVEDKKNKNSKNNTYDNLNNNDVNKEISPIKSYEEGVERLGNIFIKYHSKMNISDEKEFLNILHFFNNYK